MIEEAAPWWGVLAVNCCVTKNTTLVVQKLVGNPTTPMGTKSKVKVPLGLWDSPQLAARFQAAVAGLWFVTLELWLSRTLKTVAPVWTSWASIPGPLAC